jgi:hypothetical protein
MPCGTGFSGADQAQACGFGKILSFGVSLSSAIKEPEKQK